MYLYLNFKNIVLLKNNKFLKKKNICIRLFKCKKKWIISKIVLKIQDNVCPAISVVLLVLTIQVKIQNA